MSEETKAPENRAIAAMENKAIIEYLAETFPEDERKIIIRDMFIVTQIKTISTKEDYENDYGDTKQRNVKRKMTVYEALAYTMLCRELKFNPALDLVTMLEGSFYIGLNGHKTYAQSTGLCRGYPAVLVSETDIEYDKKEWTKGSKTPTITKAKGKRYEFKCTAFKQEGDKVIEYYGTGIADPSNVAGGDKMTDLKIMQMAEARATRRALANAFPPGVGHIEDVTEAPDYVLPEYEAQSLLPSESDRFKAAKVISKPDKKETIKAVDEVPEEPAPEALKKKVAEKPRDLDAELEDASNSDATPEDIAELKKEHEEPAEVVPTPMSEPKAKTAPEKAPAVARPGKDQIDRIRELLEMLGADEETMQTHLAPITDRDLAAEKISRLLARIETMKAKAKEEAAKAVSGEEDSSDQSMEDDLDGKTETPAAAKTSKVGDMAKKADSAASAVTEDPRFKQMFGDKPQDPEDQEEPEEGSELSAEEGSDVFAEHAGEADDLDTMSEADMRAAHAAAKVVFKQALDTYKADPTEENAAARSEASGKCAEISQAIIARGFPVV